ncbi:MAG: sulfur carrier protein ThiS, partial [Thermomicrobiales bacterium]
MNLTVNQQSVSIDHDAPTIAVFLRDRSLPDKAIVIAINGDIIARSDWDSIILKEGDDMEIVRAVSGGDHTAVENDSLTIAGVTFNSRLFLGTGKYADNLTMTAALEISGTEMVTVAIRYMNLDVLNGDSSSLLDELDLGRYHLLPNTA